jgi:hypothetical protein
LCIAVRQAAALNATTSVLETLASWKRQEKVWESQQTEKGDNATAVPPAALNATTVVATTAALVEAWESQTVRSFWFRHLPPQPRRLSATKVSHHSLAYCVPVLAAGGLLRGHSTSRPWRPAERRPLSLLTIEAWWAGQTALYAAKLEAAHPRVAARAEMIAKDLEELHAPPKLEEPTPEPQEVRAGAALQARERTEARPG